MFPTKKNSNRHVSLEEYPNFPGGGAIIILCRKIAISPQPNLRWTSDQSVNSSLSVAVQEKKTRALYLSRLKRGGPMKFENTFFQIAKFRFSSIFVDFQQISRIFKKFSGDQFKSQGPQILDSTPLYTYLSPCKNRICKIH